MQPSSNRASYNGYVDKRQKVAVMLAALEPEDAAQVLKHFPLDELEPVLVALRDLSPLAHERVVGILQEFGHVPPDNIELRFGPEYAALLIRKAFPKDQADRLIDKIIPPFYKLRDLTPGQWAMLLAGEPGEVVAVTLGFLEPDVSAQIMPHLLPDVQLQVTRRMPHVILPDSDVLRDIEERYLAKRDNLDDPDLRPLDGLDRLAKILQMSAGSVSDKVLAKLPHAQRRQLEDQLFRFEDLPQLSDHALQLVAKRVNRQILALALKGGSPDLMERFRRNLSQNALEMLQDEIAQLGPRRMNDVLKARQEVMRIVLKAHQDGDILIQRGPDEVVL